MPPGGASPHFIVPPRDMYGIRQTVNANISGVQQSWNMRSAFTVAALNCLAPQHAAILPAYKSFLETHKAGLARLNRSVEHEWRERVGSGYSRARDTYSTQVYNYFAMPPVLPRFCDTMNQIALESQAVTPTDLDVFAQQSLARVEAVFALFFEEFEKYRTDVAAWDTQYGTLYGASQTRQLSASYAQSVGEPASYSPAVQGPEAYPQPGFETTP